MPHCCWAQLVDYVIPRLNEAGRAVAARHGALIIDRERLLQGVDWAAYLWDAYHVRHKYSDVFLNLALNVLARHATQTAPPSAASRPRGTCRARAPPTGRKGRGLLTD